MAPPIAWFFLVPELSLAIRLCDGCALSWDGRVLRHCSAAPLGISRGDMLLSLWRGSKSDAQRAVLRMEEMRDALRAREMSPYVRGLAWRVGEIVWVKWTAQGEQLAGRVWRRTTGEITEVLSDGSLCIFWPSDDGDLVLDAKTVRERVVHAGVVGPRPDLAGLGLPGFARGLGRIRRCSPRLPWLLRTARHHRHPFCLPRELNSPSSSVLGTPARSLVGGGTRVLAWREP